MHTARYNLIMKDQTYLLLLKKAASKGLTMGKYLNVILNEAALKDVVETPKLCKDCGKLARFAENWPIGEKYVCMKHKTKGIGCRELVKIAVQK